MVLDYVGIIPGIAAGVMGAITLMSKEMPKWKRVAVVVLTATAIGTTGISQWWTSEQKAREQAERTMTREQLGQFEDQAGKLIAETLNNDTALPQAAAANWAMQVETFLKEKLGPSYVVRFRSDSGIPMPGSPIGIQMNRLGLLQWLHYRAARLDQFASEIPR